MSVEHESNDMSDLDDRLMEPGQITNNILKVHTPMGHVPQRSHEQEFVASVSCRGCVTATHRRERAGRTPPGTEDPPADGGTDSKQYPPQTGVPTVLLARQVPTQLCWSLSCLGHMPERSTLPGRHTQNHCNAHSKEDGLP